MLGWNTSEHPSSSSTPLVYHFTLPSQRGSPIFSICLLVFKAITMFIRTIWTKVCIRAQLILFSIPFLLALIFHTHNLNHLRTWYESLLLFFVTQISLTSWTCFWNCSRLIFKSMLKRTILHSFNSRYYFEMNAPQNVPLSCHIHPVMVHIQPQWNYIFLKILSSLDSLFPSPQFVLSIKVLPKVACL